ncbi:MAG: hypothetical protein J6T26_01330 [Firmicutes bacterium]|nr:hypothetical protein [Bacillota bacterium]
MKIKITEIEATAAELRACNTIGDGVVNMLRDVFNYQRAEDEAGEDLSDLEETEE